MMQVPDIYHQGAAGHNYGSFHDKREQKQKISCNKKIWVKQMHLILDMKWLKCGKLKDEWVKRRLSGTKWTTSQFRLRWKTTSSSKFLNRSLIWSVSSCELAQLRKRDQSVTFVSWTDTYRSTTIHQERVGAIVP